MKYFTIALLLLSSMANVTARPVTDSNPSQAQDNCSYSWKPRNAKTKVTIGAHHLQSFRCISQAEATCSLSKGTSFTSGTSFSIGISGDAKGFLNEANQAFSPSFSLGYSWFNSTTTSQTVTVTCPDGGMECGLVAIPSWCTLFGNLMARHNWPNPTNCPALPADSTYSSTSLCVQGDKQDQGGNNGVVTFEACLWNCGEGCQKKKAAKMTACPNSPASQDEAQKIIQDTAINAISLSRRSVKRSTLDEEKRTVR